MEANDFLDNFIAMMRPVDTQRFLGLLNLLEDTDQIDSEPPKKAEPSQHIHQPAF